MANDDEPKYRLEHSASDLACCQQAACKRAGVKFKKGELRLGIRRYFQPREEYILVWRHWGCVTPSQVDNIKTLAENDVKKVPGYDIISPESQEQVRQAFEAGRVVDEEFKDIRTDLVKKGNSGLTGEITNAVGYKVDVAVRAAKCRADACNDKVTKGELRLGIATMWDGEHETMAYKHWKCVSAYDLTNAEEYLEREELIGFDVLAEELKTVVMDSFKQGSPIEPPVVETVKSAPKKRKAAKKDESPKPTSKKRGADEVDATDEEYAPKKKRGRPSKKVASATVEEEGLSGEVDTTGAKAAPKKKRKPRSTKKAKAVSPSPGPDDLNATDDASD